MSALAGVVTEKLVEVGEVIAPRTPVAVLVDLDRAWADVFVPEPAVPRLRLGQAARIFTDAGGAPVAGTVTYISPRAEFTPRNVQTAEERSKLVYRVRISVDNRDGVLKQGMPVEAELPVVGGHRPLHVRRREGQEPPDVNRIHQVPGGPQDVRAKEAALVEVAVEVSVPEPGGALGDTPFRAFVILRLHRPQGAHDLARCSETRRRQERAGEACFRE